MQALGLLLLCGAKTVWQAMMFAIFFGPGYGGVVTLRLTMPADYFGRRAFGSIQGIMVTITIVGTVSFPFLTGLYYDFYGNYQLAWLIMVVIILASIPLAFKAMPPQGRFRR
jgi:MFS family permease